MARRYPLEQFFAPLYRGLSRTKTGTFAGRSTISAGSLQLIVAAAAVESNSIILMGQQTSVASAALGSTIVKSLTPGVGFVLGFTENVAQTADVVVMWRIYGQG